MSSGRIIDHVDFVKDYAREVVLDVHAERRRRRRRRSCFGAIFIVHVRQFVQFIEKYFCCHDENIGVRVCFNVAGDEPEADVRKFFPEIVKFLVGQCFYGGAVDCFFALVEEVFDGELPGHCFAGPGWRGDEQVVFAHDGLDGPFLKSMKIVFVFFKIFVV